MTATGDTTAVQRTSTEVRDLLADRVRRDLCGPFAGDTEQFDRPAPRERYIVGVLAPTDAEPDEDVGDDEDLDSGEFGDESADRPAPGVSAIGLHPSTAGLTFTVPDTVDSIQITATWGRYTQPRTSTATAGEEETTTADSERLAVNTSPPSRPWTRTPIRGTVSADLTIAADAGGRPRRADAIPAPDDAPGVAVEWIVRQVPGRRIVSAFLVNRQHKKSFPGQGGASSWLFQAALSVAAEDGAAVFLPGRDADGYISPQEDAEQAELNLLYRNHPEYAVGHGTSAAWSEPDGVDPADRRADRVWADPLPWHDVPQTQAPTPDQIPGLDGLVLDMRVLADASDGPAAAAMLRPLTSAYRAWLDEQEARITTEADVAAHATAAAANIAKARTAADRIDAGIDLIAGDEHAWQAFSFTNRVMALQRQHSVAMTRRRTDPDLGLRAALDGADAPSQRSWRPFQVAFVLLNLPALTDPADPERAAGDEMAAAEDAVADLLFFPTGGGKTEAYLGLTAYTFAIRRLQPDLGGLDASRGTAVLMRYTLRLLTSQQLQRAATLVCAAETIRQADPHTWGTEPFRVGLWVGGSVTPNYYADARGFVRSARGVGGKNDAFAKSPVPFTECPWCATPITDSRDVDADDATQTVRIYCGDDTGTCHYTRRRSADGLPVVAVDEQIYRQPPSLLIATVDKFAQLPRRAEAGHLFGRTTRECSRHGLRTPDDANGPCGHDTHRAAKGLPAAKTADAPQLRPPDLIIQDELHLIADALGTMVGLYETAVDELATWTCDGHRVRPKVVASTATVRRAAEQGYALFRRRLAVFPPPVLDVEDSFFARQVPVDADHPGRRYLGLCAQGLRLKSVEIRATSAILSFAQELFDDDGDAADPYMTLVAYFNALRELGGMRRLVEDDVSSRLSRPFHAQLPRRRTPLVSELTSRVPSQSIKQALKEIELSFDPAKDVSTARHDTKDTTGKRGKTDPGRAMAKDVLLATNMFAVGVDISRLGLMTVTGQPKATSEYIQATSRVGRDPARPGLVITIYNWVRPRDLSHYERFAHYHDTFYRQVEALSVTPFSVPALHRGITGAYFGALRHLHPRYTPDIGLDSITAADAEAQALIDVFSERAQAVTGEPDAGAEARSLLDKRLRTVANRRANAGGQTRLTYRGKGAGLSPMLVDPNSGSRWDDWTVPNSLRETEPDINLQLRPFDPSVSDTSSPPPWQPRDPKTPEEGDDA